MLYVYISGSTYHIRSLRELDGINICDYICFHYFQVSRLRINMVPRHLPKKLLCVALIGTSILAILYYTAGLSNSSEHKFSHGNENSLEKKAKNVF